MIIAAHCVGLGFATIPSGHLGPIGFNGNQGSQGVSGPSGSIGTQGQKGSVGQTGQAGLQGPNGPQGSVGPYQIGSVGPTGPSFPSTRNLRAPDAISYALLRKIRPTEARILFQTSCASVFFISSPDSSGSSASVNGESGSYGIPNPTFGIFTYVPKLNYSYSGPELADEISFKANQASFPLSARFLGNKFLVSCTTPGQTFRVTDREYAEIDLLTINIQPWDANKLYSVGEKIFFTQDNKFYICIAAVPSVGYGPYGAFIGTYWNEIANPQSSFSRFLGARYGECTRFFNHLDITVDISYQRPYNPGMAYSSLESNSEILDYIGFGPIPEPPNAPALNINGSNALLLNLNWTSNSMFQTGIYLSSLPSGSTTAGALESWDLEQNTVELYKFTDLNPGDSYFAGISFIGTYDESSIIVTSVSTPVTSPSSNSFNVLLGGNLNTLNLEINPNEFKTILGGPVSWPVDLTTYEQIISISIKFYANIRTGLPSDARITFGPDGPLVYYMYWRTVALDARDPSTLTNNYEYAFASVTNSPVGTLGPVSPPLPYERLFISNPNQLRDLFANGTALITSPPSLTMFVGYFGSLLEINAAGSSYVPVVEEFIIYYT